MAPHVLEELKSKGLTALASQGSALHRFSLPRLFYPEGYEWLFNIQSPKKSCVTWRVNGESYLLCSTQEAALKYDPYRHRIL